MILKLRSLYLFAIIGISLISCEDAPEGIQNALFDEVSESGFIQPAFSITITYDDNNNRSLNWGEFVGFDFYMTNNNELPFTDISITFNGASESVFANFDNEPSSLSIVPSFSSKSPIVMHGVITNPQILLLIVLVKLIIFILVLSFL